MPVTFAGGHFTATCETCGAEAHFGYGVKLRAAIKAKDPKLAGRWYCAAHRPS